MDSQGRLAAEKADSKAAEARRVYDQRLTREIEDSWFGFVPWKTTEALRERTLEGAHQEGCHARVGVSALTEVASSAQMYALNAASHGVGAATLGALSETIEHDLCWRMGSDALAPAQFEAGERRCAEFQVDVAQYRKYKQVQMRKRDLNGKLFDVSKAKVRQTHTCQALGFRDCTHTQLQ